MNASPLIEQVLDFAIKKKLICAADRAYTRNLLMDIMRMDAPDADECEICAKSAQTLQPLLIQLAQYAERAGVYAPSAEARERFITRLAGAVTPSPYEVRERFLNEYAKSPEAATDWFYSVCAACDYIKLSSVKKNIRYFAHTNAGELEITINLSKPEKDPRDIAKARAEKDAGYPKCMLCAQNSGYAGREGFPARHNHRMIPINLAGEEWYMQYSPYLYYNEHTIVLSNEHRPMRVSEATFLRLFEFVDMFPHYFLGSNADLPIVGGSILSHDHFQGGRYEFPMDRAPDEIPLTYRDARVSAAIIDWPMSCVRLKSESREALTKLAVDILYAWREYSDEMLGIYAQSARGQAAEKHNAVTPILHRESGIWRLDIVLRNNRVSDEHPLGIFHPHAELHHIKKENIGLIEVMGLMILPGRLAQELKQIERILAGELAVDTPIADDSPLKQHEMWIEALISQYGRALSEDEARSRVRQGVADICARVLTDAGVYKRTTEGRAGFVRFLKTVGLSRA